jgi:hypothetical protein
LLLKATSGSDCGYTGPLPIGSQWVAAVNQWRDQETGQELFAILGCGSSALALTDGEVKGHIFRPASLNAFDPPHPWDRGHTITLEELRAHLENLDPPSHELLPSGAVPPNPSLQRTNPGRSPGICR